MRPSSFFSSLSSSSSATATTTSSNGSTFSSKNGSAAGCFTRVLRRLLCLRSLPTYPCDHFNEEEIETSQNVEANSIGAFNTPVVARLMGLEAPPNIIQKTPNSMGRSQSMNSIHSLTTLKSIQGRRVKSFREIPSYLDLEDESFFIISFENVGKGRKSDMNSGDAKQKRRAPSKNKGRDNVQEQQNKETREASIRQQQGDLISSKTIYSNHKIRDSSNVIKNSCEKSFVIFELVKPDHKGKGGRRKRKKKTRLEVDKLETQTSPNSILDFTESPPEPDPDSPDSGSLDAEASRSVNSKSPRTLSKLEGHRKTEKNRLIRDDYDHKRSKGKWDEICQLVERETLQSNWTFNEISKAYDFKEICKYLAQETLDQILADLLNNLLEIPMKCFDPPP